MRIVNKTTGAVLATDARAARNVFTRTRGLLGTRNLPEGSGLLIEPCNSVHMFGMTYPLHVVYLDRAHKVLWAGVLRPWRAGPLLLWARVVIELPPSTLGLVQEGDEIEFAEKRSTVIIGRFGSRSSKGRRRHGEASES